MAKAPANPKRKPAKASAAAAAPAVATPTEIMRRNREAASAPDRVASLHDERLVFQAVMRSRPGTRPGPSSPLWKPRKEGGIGVGGVLHAARLYLVEFQSAAKVREGLGIAASMQRALDRLLYVIQEEHSALLEKDYDERLTTEQYSPVDGDVARKADAVLESAFDRMLPVVKRMNWDECEVGERNNLMRFFEIASDAKKIATDARYKEAQTDRIEAMLRGVADRAKAKGAGTIDLGEFSRVIDQAFGLAAPAPRQEAAA